MGRGVAALLAGIGTGYMTGQRMASDQRREERENERFAFERRRMAREEQDQAEIRAALTPPAHDGRAAVANAGYTDLADVTAGDTQPVSATGSAATPASVAANGVPAIPQRASREEDGDLRRYFERVKPRIIQTYLRQGKPEKAKAYLDFVESEDGREYTRAWAKSMRKVATGDFDGAIPELEKLYTNIPDGQRAKATHLGDGKYRLDFLDEKTGEILRTSEADSATLARSAVMFLDPARATLWHAQRAADLEKEAIQSRRLDRQAELLDRREALREDRRDERLQQRLDASERNLERRLSARGGLTATQERQNEEIKAARNYITGLSDNDIRKRTQQYQKSGRINDDYDPKLERAVKLAERHMIGDDPWFDQRHGQDKQPAGPKKTPKEQALETLAADPNMAGYTLGEQTGRGFKVLDKNGKHVGYLGRQ